MLKYRLHRCVAIASKVIILAFAIAVVLLAILTSLLKYYAPLIEDYRPQILEKINSSNNIFTVSAGSIRSYWQPLQPQLILENVNVMVKGQDEVGRLNRLQVDIDLFLSLYYRTVYIERLEADKLSLKLKQSKAGLWGLRRTAKKAASAPPSNFKALLKRLWNVENLVLNQLDVSLEAYGMSARQLPTADVNFSGSAFAKQAVVEFVDGGVPKAKLLMNSEGRPFDKDFSMQAYSQISDIDILYYLPFLDQQFGLKSLKARGEVWFDYKDQALVVSGHSEINDAHWQKKQSDSDQSLAETSSPSFSFDQLLTNYNLTFSEHSADLWIDSINIGYNDSQISTQPLHITLAQPKNDNEPTFVKLQTPSLALKPLADFALQQPLPEKVKDVFETLAIRGSLEQVTLELPIAFDKSQASFFELASLNAKVNNVSTKPYKVVPGLTNVSGLAFSNILSGQLYAEAEGFELFFKKLFPEPMVFDKAKALIAWNIIPDKKRLLLNGTELSMFTEGLGNGNGEFYLDVPLKKGFGEPGQLSLAIGLNDNNAKYKHWFIPKQLDARILDWIDANVLAGHVNQGAFIFHGPVTKNAIGIKSSQLWLDIDDAKISYLKDWPEVKQINGEFLLDNFNVAAYINSAYTKGLHLDDAKLDIAIDPKGKQSEINVLGQFSGEVKHALSFLKSKGLHSILNNQLAYLSSNTGAVRGDLAITIPLVSKTVENDERELALALNANIENGQLYSSRLDLTFDDIDSNIKFDLENSLSSDELTLTVLGSPVKANINGEVVYHQHKVSVNFMADVHQLQLQQRFQQPIFKFLNGAAAIDGLLVFAGDNSFLKVNSNLQGFGVDLPSPFNKAKKASREFQLLLPLSDEVPVLSMSYGQATKMQMRLNNGDLDAMLINLGVHSNEFVSNKIIIAGQLAEVDTQQWLDFVERYNNAAKAEEGDGDEVERWSLLVDKLHVNRLDAFESIISNSKISIFDQAAYWQLQIDHEDISGRLRIPNDDSVMVANIHHLNLDLFAGDDEANTSVAADGVQAYGLADPRLADFPDMAVTIEQLRYQGKDFGQWEFDVSADESSMRFDNIIASVTDMQVGGIGEEPASLSWSLGENSQSHFVGRIGGANIGNTLRAWGYNQQVNSESVEFFTRLSWQGVPSDFEINHLTGSVDMNLNKGNFADVGKSQANALKVLGLLNVSALLKRLRLDFSDLSKDGLSYDKVEGVLAFNKGIITIDDPVQITGTSSNISIDGEIDLLTENLDLNMGVTIPFVSNIPWLAALAAGLPAAVGVFIISKLLKKQVDKLSSALYKVTGDLNDPQIKFEKVFSTNAD